MLSFLQKFVAADKSALAAAIIGGLTVLAAKFGFRMNGADVAYLSAGVTAGLGLFVHAHFASKAAKAAKPAAPPVASEPVHPA